MFGQLLFLNFGDIALDHLQTHPEVVMRYLVILPVEFGLVFLDREVREALLFQTPLDPSPVLVPRYGFSSISVHLFPGSFPLFVKMFLLFSGQSYFLSAFIIIITLF